MRASSKDEGSTKPRRTVDARGACCPLSPMELTKAVSQQEMGGEEAILSSDPNSDRDISNWVAKQGHRLAAKIPHDGFLELIVRKMEE